MAIRQIICGSLLLSVIKSSKSIINRTTRSFSETSAATSKLIYLSSIFQRYGFSPSQLPAFLKTNDSLLHINPSEIEKSFRILKSFNSSQDFLVSVVNKCPRVIEFGFLDKWQSGILNLGIRGISPTALTNILEISRKFGLSSDEVCRRVECLKSLGLSDATISRVLEAVDIVIVAEPDHIFSKIEFLLGVGFHCKEIDRVCNLFPRILAFDLKNRLKPLFGEFEDLGFSSSHIRREIIREPAVLGLENGELSQCLEFLKTLKCRVPIREHIFQNGEFRAGYNVKLRIDCLRKYGLIYRDAFTVLWKEPRVVLYPINEIEEKIIFLLNRNFDVMCLIEIPEYLGVNFHKQIVPRFKVIDYLKSSGRFGDEVSLRDLIKPSRLRFYNMYVKPYPECESIFGRSAGDVEVLNRFPVGMWKLFRPQQY